MTNQLLVAPVSVGGSAAAPSLSERVVPIVARSAASLSRALLGGRGVGLGCTLAADMIGSDGRILFRLGGGGSFGVRTDDRYWLHYLLLEGRYETDLDHFLHRTLSPQDSFLDCGSNLGLWSIAVARVIDDPRRVVAVEAGSRTFAQLERNWQDNERGFTILHRALGISTGEELSFFASVGDHASATLVEGLSPADAKREVVTTVSLNDLLTEQRALQQDDAITFVKLDVEGMERPVLATLEAARDRDLIVLYEDHGSDADHVSRFVLESGFRVAFMADDGRLEPIQLSSLDRLTALKVDSARGYNLLAYSPSGPAASRLKRLFGLPVATVPH